MSEREQDKHWLVRESTIRRLWLIFSVILALTVAGQILIYVKGYFTVDSWFGFGAAFGFGSCVIMILVAKVLGMFLKRKDTYYQNGEDDA